MNSNPCIIAENLEKSFGERKVLKGLSLEVEKGEVFGLLGHNGAGKSTTIDLLLGLKEPDKGSSSILGMNNRGRSLHRIRILIRKSGGLYRSFDPI